MRTREVRGSGWIGQYDLMGLRQFQPGGKSSGVWSLKGKIVSRLSDSGFSNLYMSNLI